MFLLATLLMFTFVVGQQVLQYPTATDSTIPSTINVPYSVSAVHITLNRSVAPLGGLTTNVRIVLVDWVLPTSGAGSATRALLINVTRQSSDRNISITVDGDSGSAAPSAVAVRSSTTACSEFASTIRQVRVVISSVEGDATVPLPTAPPCTYNVSDGSGLPSCVGPLLVASHNMVVLRNLALCGATSGAVLTPGWPDAWGVTLANVQLADSASVSVYPARTMRVSSSLDNVHVTLGLPLTVRSGAHVSISALMNATVVIDAASTSTKQLAVDGTGSSVVVSSCGLVSDSTLGYAGFSHNLQSSATSAASVISVTGGAALRIVNNTCLGSRVANTVARSAQDVCALVLAASSGILVDGVGSTLQVSGNVVSATGGTSPAGWGTAWFGGLAVVVLSSSSGPASVSVTGGSSLLVEGNRVSCAHRGISLVSSVDSVATNGAGCSLIVSGSLVSVSNNTVTLRSVPNAPATPSTPVDVALDLWLTGTAGVLTLSASSSVLLHGNVLSFVGTNDAAMMLRVWVQRGPSFSLQQQSLLSVWNNTATFAPTSVATIDALLGVVTSIGAVVLQEGSSLAVVANSVSVVSTVGSIRVGGLMVSGSCASSALSFIDFVTNGDARSLLNVSANKVSLAGAAVTTLSTGSTLPLAAGVPFSLLYVGGVFATSPTIVMCPLLVLVNHSVVVSSNDLVAGTMIGTTFGASRPELFGVLVVASSVSAPSPASSSSMTPLVAVSGNSVLMLQCLGRLVVGVAIRATTGTVALLNESFLQVSNNVVTITAATTGTMMVFHVLGVAMLLPRLTTVVSAPTTATPGLLMQNSSTFSMIQNTVSVTASRSVTAVGFHAAVGVYLGAEPPVSTTVGKPTSIWVSAGCRLAIDQNLISSATGTNINAVGILAFKEALLTVQTSSIVQVSGNTVLVSATATVASSNLVAIGVYATDAADVKAAFSAATIATTTATTPQHTLTSNALVKMSSNNVTLVNIIASSTSSTVYAVGAGWTAGSVAAVAVSNRCRWILSLNAIQLVNPTGGARAIVHGIWVTSGGGGAGVGALFLSNSSSMEIESNTFSLSPNSSRSTNRLVTLSFKSTSTITLGRSPAVVALTRSSKFSVSLNVMKGSGGLPAAAGVAMRITNAAGIGLAVWGASVFALDSNDAYGDGSMGTSSSSSFNKIALAGPLVSVDVSATFAGSTGGTPPALVVANVDGVTQSTAQTYFSVAAIAVCLSSAFGVRQNVASSILAGATSSFLSVSWTTTTDGAASPGNDAGLVVLNNSQFSVSGNQIDKAAGAADAISIDGSMKMTSYANLNGLVFRIAVSSSFLINNNLVNGGSGTATSTNGGIAVTSTGDSSQYCYEGCSASNPCTVCVDYYLLAYTTVNAASTIQFVGNIISVFSTALEIEFGDVTTLSSSGSSLLITNNYLASASAPEVMSMGATKTIQSTYGVTMYSGTYAMIQRNTFVLTSSSASVRYCMYFYSYLVLADTSSRLYVKRNKCVTALAAAYLLAFDSLTGNANAAAVLGSCDEWKGRLLVDRKDYAAGGAVRLALPALCSVLKCVTFSFTRTTALTDTNSVEASVSPDKVRASVTHAIPKATKSPTRRTPTRSRRTESAQPNHTQSSLLLSRTFTIADSATPERSTVSEQILLSPSQLVTPSATIQGSHPWGRVDDGDQARNRVGQSATLPVSLSESTTLGNLTTTERGASPSASHTFSCAPAGDLAAVSPLFQTFLVTPDVLPAPSFAYTLPAGGVLVGAPGVAVDAAVLLAVTHPVDGPSPPAPPSLAPPLLPVVLCRRSAASQVGSSVPYEVLLDDMRIVGNGTVNLYNGTSFHVVQWADDKTTSATTTTYANGDILEIRFRLQDFFATTMHLRTSRNAIPCRPSDTFVLAYVQLQGSLSAAQAAVRSTVGTISIVTMVFSLILGDGGGDLQTMILVSMMECTPQGGSVQNSLANLRSLAPLLVDETYVGVIWGNIVLIAAVFGVQCVAMAAVALFRRLRHKDIKLGLFDTSTSSSMFSSDKRSCNDEEGTNDSLSSQQTLTEMMSMTAGAVEDVGVSGEMIENTAPEHNSNNYNKAEGDSELDDILALTDPHKGTIMTATAEMTMISVAAESALSDRVLDNGVAIASTAKQNDGDINIIKKKKKNGMPITKGIPKTIVSLVAFPGMVMSAAVYAFQGTLFAGIRLMQIYRPGTPSSSGEGGSGFQFAVGIVVTLMLFPVPFVAMLFLHQRMHRSYHIFIVPLGKSEKRLNVLHRLFSLIPVVECAGVMLPRGVGRVWGALVSSCRPHRVWCALPFASGWIMCVAALVQFSTSNGFCTTIIAIVGFVNVFFAVVIMWLRPKKSYLLNVLLFLQLCNNAAALFVNAVSIHRSVPDELMIVIGLLQSLLSICTTFGTLSVTLSYNLQYRGEALLELLWSVGPLCPEAVDTVEATSAVCLALEAKRRQVRRLIQRYRNNRDAYLGLTAGGMSNGSKYEPHHSVTTLFGVDYLLQDGNNSSASSSLWPVLGSETNSTTMSPRVLGGGGGGALRSDAAIPSSHHNQLDGEEDEESVVNAYMDMLGNAPSSAGGNDKLHASTTIANRYEDEDDDALFEKVAAFHQHRQQQLLHDHNDTTQQPSSPSALFQSFGNAGGTSSDAEMNGLRAFGASSSLKNHQRIVDVSHAVHHTTATSSKSAATTDKANIKATVATVAGNAAISKKAVTKRVAAASSARRKAGNSSKDVQLRQQSSADVAAPPVEGDDDEMIAPPPLLNDETE